MNTTPITTVIDLDSTDDSDAHAIDCICDECIDNRRLAMLEDRAA